MSMAAVPPRQHLHWQVLLAMLAAVACAALLPPGVHLGDVTLQSLCQFGGGLFLNALKMLVIPLVSSSLVVAVMSLEQGQGFGRLFGRLLGWVLATGLIAAAVGLVMVNLVAPGRAQGVPMQAAASAAADAAPTTLLHVLSSLVPANPLAAAASDQLLGVVVFSLLFGVFASRLPPAQSAPIRDLAKAVFATMIAMARWVLMFAPLGVFLLALDALLGHGFGVLAQLGAYMGTVLAALAVHACVVLPLLLRLAGGRPAWPYFQAMFPALTTAFATASSKAALPVTMQALEHKAQLPPRVTRFVLPLSATINMNGSALYECVAALFIAQLYGIPLGVSGQLLIVLVSLLTTLGLSGMPGAGAIGLTTVLAAAGLPAEGMALVLAVDRVLDMARTAVNVWGEACIAAIVGRGEGEGSAA
jgi:proton glutamate symport protein